MSFLLVEVNLCSCTNKFSRYYTTTNLVTHQIFHQFSDGGPHASYNDDNDNSIK